MKPTLHRPARAGLSGLRHLLAAAVFAGVMAGSLSAQAQTGAMPAADEQAIGRVVLGDDLLGRLQGTAKDGKARGIHTGIPLAEVARLDSLDALAKTLLAADPRLAGVLARHGFTARDYAAAVLALMRAGVAAQLPASPAALRGTTPANVAYVKSHRAKVQAVLSDDEDEDADDE